MRQAIAPSRITGIRGKWSQISLEKKLVGYINIGGAPGYLPPIATAPATAAPCVELTMSVIV